MIILVLPVLCAQAQNTKSHPEPKIHKKEIPVSKLPEKVKTYISANLPSAKITRIIKQKRSPEAKFIVTVNIKTKHHILVFNKAGDLVKLDGKKVYTSVVDR